LFKVINNIVSLLSSVNALCRAVRLPTLALLCIAGLTLCLFFPPLEWFFRQLVIEPINGMIFLMLPVVWFFRPRVSLQLFPVHFSLVPGLLFSLSIVAYLANENHLGIHIFSAVLFIVAIYSLLGLVLPSAQWRALFLPACLLVVVLPFSGYLDIYLGYPLRLLCANLSGEALRLLGFTSISNESIILIEERAANVDLDCSGIKGIWMGGIFYLLLSIIEEHRISWRWLMIGIGFITCLLIANVMRIVLLVLLGAIGGFYQFADIVHQCLGLLGFGFSCVLAWGALRVSRPHRLINVVESELCVKFSKKIVAFFVGGLLLALWLHEPYQTNEVKSPLSVELSADLKPQHLALSRLERDFFANNQASVYKFRFDFESINGSALIVSSRYWKAQHEPHNCYLSQGFSLGFEGTWLLTNKSAVHFLRIDESGKTAVYWFQSADRITPDYSARVIDGVLAPHKNWLMVSLLLNRHIDKIEIEKLLLRIQSGLATQLTSGLSHE